MRKLWIDGTARDGCYMGERWQAEPELIAPYAVFDEEKQDWLVTGLPYRWMAALYIWWHQ